MLPLPTKANVMPRSNSAAAPRTEPVSGRGPNASNRPANPVGGQTAAASGVITAQQLEELKHRHLLQLALVKQEARDLKQEKAFLVAQNLRLERELCLQNNQALAPGGVVDQRVLDSRSRPSFHRSRSHPNSELRDPHHSLCLSSPTHSCSSCSSHPWVSSGGTNTPSSHSPRSYHSRNPSSASLAVPSSHAPPPMSRRPSFSGGVPPMTSAPDPVLLHQRLRMASRQQKLNNVLNPLRPLSVASHACDDTPRPLSSRSNPASRGVSRRNSVSSGNAHDHPPLKGILKPSTPIRPLSSCAATAVRPPTRPSTGMGYYVDEAYDSITHPHGHRTASTTFTYPGHHPTCTPRTRRGSIDYINGAGERLSSRHGYS